jgi:uncharacterized oligopeptide transporter (OPT) family protein
MEKDINTPARHDSDPAESFHGDEKGHHTIDVDGGEEEVDSFIRDPFHPFDDLPPEKHWVMTIRAVFVGLCCGCLVNASNVYLGLKTGWTFNANLFGVSAMMIYKRNIAKRIKAIAGFAVLKFFSTTFAENFPILGGSFGPKENNIVQTAAMASGGLSNVFVSAYPALYQLKLLDTPKNDFWRIVSLTAVGGYFGFFFATPRTDPQT